MRISTKVSTLSIGTMLAISSLFVYASIRSMNVAVTGAQAAVDQQIALYDLIPKNLFKGFKIEGKAAYVLDINSSKTLFRKNEKEQLPLASITKVMTALVAMENGSPDQIVTISSKALDTDGDSGLKEGERWKLKDLIDYTLLVSSNDGAQAIADAIGEQKGENFVSMMNEKAKLLGLPSLRFTNPSGLDSADYTDTGGKGDAVDVAKLFAYIITEHRDLLNATRYQTGSYSSETLKHDGKNTDTIVDNVPRMLGSKTGFTALAGGNLGIVFEVISGRPIVIVVLGSSYESRFSDVYSLASTTLQTYNRR